MLDLAARMTREGTRGSPADRETGKAAANYRNHLISRFVEEDRAAGRTDPVAFVRKSLAHGWDPLA